MSEEYVVLVDEQDNEIGTMEKMDAHRQAALHRAVSVFIFNSKKELLLQQRASGKYHSGGLWTNTCCSHPRWKEDIKAAAERRLYEEMGMKCRLQHVTQITYRAGLNNGLTENELDHIFVGHTDMQPVLNANEATDYRYLDIDTIKELIKAEPGSFTEWFKILFEPVINELLWKKYL